MNRLKLVVGMVAALFVLALPAGASAHAKKALRASDRNHDRLPDRWEKRHGLSLKLKQASRDPDHDGLSNLGEYESHTDPRDADTDDDGVSDGTEENEGTDPTDEDTNDDGVLDGHDDPADEEPDPGDAAGPGPPDDVEPDAVPPGTVDD